MTSQTGQQTTTLQILPNILGSKCSQTMKFENNHAKNEAGRLVPDHFLFFKNAFLR